VLVSSNVIVADFEAPVGCVNIADNTVAVSAFVSEINDNVTTAVADSPAMTVSVAESMVRVGAMTVAFVGSADVALNAKAAAIAIEI
jgi:acyl CoA:acetate/3-ketoacid CoA transferase beta subunit